MKKTEKIIKQYYQERKLDFEAAMVLYREASLHELILLAHHIRMDHHPDNTVTWIIDRNVNITNVCISGCQFCNYFRAENHPESYITQIGEYQKKIEELFNLGGRQLLLQGGLHPKLGLSFYKDLFSKLKQLYPELKLHALGPPEIDHLSKMERCSHGQVLDELIQSGLDSLPGAGAEILSDRVRKSISRNKCTTGEWLSVMREAHKRGMVTSATMMFGHIETAEERIRHLFHLRDLQSEKPENTPGFLSFIPWPFQDKNTTLNRLYNISNQVTANEYIRLIATARIILYNVPNIQASWLTVGKDIAQICLHAGANDFGSIMIEENVVSSAGSDRKMDQDSIQEAIREAGFEPRLRNQRFELL